MNINPNETYTREETDEKGAFWLALHAKAAEGVQAVLDAQAAQASVAEVLESDSVSDELKAQAQVVHNMSQEFIAGMVATGATLVQIISEPTKPLSKFVTLHNIMETTEGPPNQPLRDVYEITAAEVDSAITDFRMDIGREMAAFDALADN